MEKMIEEYVRKLAEETDAVRQSEEFKAYLDAAARFWRYSFHNQVLIHVQMRQATRVAGFRTWNELGRKIIAGSKAIKILAPSIKKAKRKNEEVQEEEVIITRFVSVSVFDVSQTNGKPLPSLDVRVEGDDFKPFLDKLLTYCASLNIAVEVKNLGVNGLYGYSKGGKITLDSKQAINSQACTLVHEIAHELLHQTPEGETKFSKNEQELQAESVAYVVCRAMGLEAKSPTYLAVYQADKTKILGCMEVISGTARKILDATFEGH